MCKHVIESFKMDLRLMQSWILWQWILLTGIMVTASGKSITTEIYPFVTPSEFSQKTEIPLSRYERGLEDYDEEQERLNQEQGRGMLYDDHGHEHEPMMEQSEKAIKNDPWQGYYDFLINEGSFKFWAVFQVVTAAILIYSALAAVYYAKYNFIQADYDDDYLFGRSATSGRSTETLWSGLSMETFQRILDAISSKKYS